MDIFRNGKKNRVNHNKIPHRGERQQTSRIYYWLWSEQDGRKIIWGPFLDFASAERRGHSKLGGNFSVEQLRTRDEAEASRLLRSKLLDETGDIPSSFRRFRHTGNE